MFITLEYSIREFIYYIFAQVKNPKPNWQNLFYEIIHKLFLNWYALFQGKSVRGRSTSRLSISKVASSSNDGFSGDAFLSVEQVKLTTDKDKENI